LFFVLSLSSAEGPALLVIPREKRGIQYAAASRFNREYSGILDRPPSRAMTTNTKPTLRSYV
jgi:hypothetical protein